MENKYAELPWAERRSRLVDALLSTGELDVIGFQVCFPPSSGILG